MSISNSNFAGYTDSKNLVQTRQKFQFIKLEFSNSIFQNPSADRCQKKVWCNYSIFTFYSYIFLKFLNMELAGTSGLGYGAPDGRKNGVKLVPCELYFIKFSSFEIDRQSLLIENCISKVHFVLRS